MTSGAGRSAVHIMLFVLLAAFAVLAVIAAACLRRKMQKKNKKVSPRPTINPRIPGNGTPLLHGVKVVELATVVAGPSCGVLMASFGAEVIKIEDKKVHHALNQLS